MALGSAIQASASAVDNMINNIFGYVNTSRVNSANARQAREAREFSADFTREMYEREYNDYSPRAQVARLVEAGLNPQGLTPSSGSSGISTPTMAATMQRYNPDFHMSSAFLEGLKLSSEIEHQNLENERSRQTLGYDVETAKVRSEQAKQTLSGMLSENRITKANADLLESTLPSLVQKTNQELSNMKQTFSNLKAQYDNLVAERSRTDEETKRVKLENDIKLVRNNFEKALYQLGISPDSHGVDRLIDMFLHDSRGSQALSKIFDVLMSPFDVSPSAFSKRIKAHMRNFNPSNLFSSGSRSSGSR